MFDTLKNSFFPLNYSFFLNLNIKIKKFIMFFIFFIIYFYIKNNDFYILMKNTSGKDVTFQDPATGIMEGIIDLHHEIFYYLIIITFFVLSMLIQILYYFNLSTNLKWFPMNIRHDSLLEIIWTIIPTLLLIFIAIPSFAVLYAIDEIYLPSITLKAIGHQWYWSYEYSDSYIGRNPIVFESRMLTLKDLILKKNYSFFGHYRLLETDNRVCLPEKVNIRLLVTSADVLHSWAIPAFGVKIDACPGRLNEVSFYLKRTGTFNGQCSEICGVNHSFMPINVSVVDLKYFLGWQILELLNSKSLNFS